MSVRQNNHYLCDNLIIHCFSTVQSIRDQIRSLKGYIAKWKTFCIQSQNMGNESDQPRPTIFRRCWASCNDVWERRRERRQDVNATIRLYFDASLFVCLSFFFLSFFLCSFSVSSLFKRTALIWMEHRTTLPVSVWVCVCVRACVRACVSACVRARARSRVF